MARRRGRGLVLSPRKQQLAGGESPGWEGYWQGLPGSGGEVYADLVETKKEIRDFLTSRRARITPEQAGLRSYGSRRVPGLRREEVAVLAGVSVPYYTRLERGDMNGVSQGVLEALARALELVRTAAECGADAVKLQVFTANSLMQDSASFADYQRERAEESTANLLGPIIVNRDSLQAVQAVLSPDEYDIRAPLVGAAS